MSMSDFDKKNLLEIYRMSLDELSHYYRLLRRYEFENNKPLESSELKRRMHKLTMLVLKIDRFFSKRQLVVFDDKRGDYKNISKGKIYAASHVGRYDIESCMEAIDDQTYFVMGDPEETYRNFEGFFLDKLHGRICVDTGYQQFENMQKLKRGIAISEEDQKLIDEYKMDRHICEIVCRDRVKNKDNILIYPEGAWNITPRLTQRLFPGAAKIAVNGDGVIIPVGVVRDSKRYTVNIGNPINVEGATIEDVPDITEQLKEKLNSLKGEIIFADNRRRVSRTTLGSFDDVLEEFIDDIMSETANGYTREVIESSRYYDKDAPENVFKIYKKTLN